MVVILTSSTDSVVLDVVKNISFNTSRVVNTYVFTDDTAAILDEGKNIDQIVVSGVFHGSSFSSYANTINTMMDRQDEITVTGFDDNNLNTDYIINDFNFDATGGRPEVYDFNITLERLRDRLPY